MKDLIPSYELTHANKKVFFAIRSMEEIEKKMQGKPDVPHRHEYYTLIWVKKGAGIHYMDYVAYPIQAQTVFCVSPHQVHQVVQQPDIEGMVLMFNPDFLTRNYIQEDFIKNIGLFSETGNTPPLSIADEDAAYLNNICSEVYKAIHNNENYQYEIAGAYLKLFLICCNKYAPKAKTTNTQSLQSTRGLVKNFKELLEQNFAKWHKVAEYAQMLHVSPDYLNSSIKTAIGITAKDFIQNRIITEAKRLGIHTTSSSKEIAYELGFEDPAHFSKFFSRIDGQPFSTFRKNLEKELHQ